MGEEGGGGVKLPPCLKLVRIMLRNAYFESWHISTDIYAVSEDIHFITKVLLILLMSAFFCKKVAFSSQNSTFAQRNSVRTVLEIF